MPASCSASSLWGEYYDEPVGDPAMLCAHAGLLAFMVTAVSTLLSYEAKLKAFMADIAGEDFGSASSSAAAAAVKGD